MLKKKKAFRKSVFFIHLLALFLTLSFHSLDSEKQTSQLVEFSDIAYGQKLIASLDTINEAMNDSEFKREKEKECLYSLLKNFNDYAEQSLKDWEAVGMSIAIIKDGELIYVKGFGKRSVEDQQAVTPDTLFQIGSITKAFTTTLSAIAIDKGFFRWQDTVEDYIPEFMLYDPWVTRQFQIADLYAQRSGLPTYAGDTQNLLGIPDETMFYNLRFFKPISSFRSQFAYQNIFFSVGAEILERTTGKKWATLLKEEIFKPLGMNNSSSSLKAYLSVTNRAGWHLRQGDGTVVQISDDFDGANWVYHYGPAGGINSTAKDLAKWLIFQTNQGTFQGQQLVSKHNLAATTRPYTFIGNIYNENIYYCLGWVYLDYSPFPIIWHNGGTSGVSNNLAFVPQDKIGIAVLCNTRGTLLAEALTMQFFDMYYGKQNNDWSRKLLDQQKIKEERQRNTISVDNPEPSLPLENYTGIYKNPVYGEVQVFLEGDVLKVQIGPKPTIWTLQHVNKDAFSFHWPIHEERSNVFFHFNAQNKPSTMVIDLLQKEGQGTFTLKK